MMENLESPSSYSSDINTPKDYSLSSLDLCIKDSDPPISRSMKLKFGVERLLSNNTSSEISNKNEEDDNNHDDAVPLSEDLGLNLLHQQLLQSTPSLILKPFPLRFGNNQNRYSHHSSNYFQSNNRKVPITSSINALPAAYSALNSYHGVIRLPSLPQISPSASNGNFYTQKKDCEKGMLSSSGNSSNVKRKRSWSRAVFSNLQRKGLERQFEFQKYITKPDRKKLAARLGLKDAQVKVWFQNRRMKWRHSTRSTSAPNKSNSHENLNMNDDDHFTSSDDEDMDIDVVTDH